MEKELSIVELERQDAQLLPARETLALANFAGIVATNQALALNAASFGSTATATAMQGVVVTQS
jgi:hypothetical protein